MRVKFYGKAGDSYGSPQHESDWVEVDDDLSEEDLSGLAYEFALEEVRIEAWFEVES